MAEVVPTWKITVANSTALKVTQVGNPPDLNAPRKEFDTFEITLEGYVPLRFLGEDDNKVNKKRAVRVMDGGKPYEVGFDVDTTFKVSIFEEGDLFFYTIEGGTADKTKKTQLIGGDLGPKEFITDEQRVNYYTMQIFVKSIYYQRDSEYGDIQKWYGDLKAAAKDWDLNLYPKILTVATDIVDYCRVSQSSVAGFLEAMEEIKTANEQDKKDIIDGVKQILSDLKKTAQSNYTNADNIYQSLGKYNLTLSDLNGTGQKLYDTYTVKIGDNSLEVTQLKERIRVLKDGLPAKLEKYHEYCLIAETTPTYLVVPFVGWIAAAIVAGVFGDKAVKMLNEINDDQNEIRDKEKKLADDQKEYVSLESNHNDIATNKALVQKAMDAVSAYRGAWGAIAGDLDKNIQQLDNATPDKPFAFKAVQLKTLQAQWKSLEDKADQFRVTAFITTKTE